MCFSSTECYHFEPSHQSHVGESLDRKRIVLKGIDTSFTRRDECRTEQEVAHMERALASFHAAIAKDYGFEEAARAAADWIEELQKTDADGHRDWRSVTARAAHRLALRVIERHPIVGMSRS